MASSAMAAKKRGCLGVDRTRDSLWLRDQGGAADLMRLNPEFQGEVIVCLCCPLPLFFIIGQRNEANALSRKIAGIPFVGTF